MPPRHPEGTRTGPSWRCRRWWDQMDRRGEAVYAAQRQTPIWPPSRIPRDAPDQSRPVPLLEWQQERVALRACLMARGGSLSDTLGIG